MLWHEAINETSTLLETHALSAVLYAIALERFDQIRKDEIANGNEAPVLSQFEWTQTVSTIHSSMGRYVDTIK